MKKIIFGLICFLPFQILGQTNEIDHSQINKEDQVKILKWYLETTEMGIEKIGDSVIYSKEFVKVLNNEKYRNFLFPKEYKMELAAYLIDKKYLKQAFWYFINLYPQNKTNKELIIKIVLGYDSIFKMDEMLVNTFYTYSFMDPEISIIKNGKPEIVRPDILEEKLGHVKEMVAYITKYREQQVKEGD